MTTLRKRGLDELVLEALVTKPKPLPQPSDSDMSIEIVFDDDDDDLLDIAVTNRFVRFSAPYERIEIESIPSVAAFRTRSTTFVKTVRAADTTPMPAQSATMSFDKAWFDQEDALPEIEDAPNVRPNSWLWLGVLLAFASLATGLAYYSFGG